MEMVLFLESLVEAVTIFCFLHAVTEPTFEMWEHWDYEQLWIEIKGQFRPIHVAASSAPTFYGGKEVLCQSDLVDDGN